MCIPAIDSREMLVDLAISLQCYVGLGNTSDRDDQPVIKCRQVSAVSRHTVSINADDCKNGNLVTNIFSFARENYRENKRQSLRKLTLNKKMSSFSNICFKNLENGKKYEKKFEMKEIKDSYIVAK